jgi:hypothetical protein
MAEVAEVFEQVSRVLREPRAPMSLSPAVRQFDVYEGTSENLRQAQVDEQFTTGVLKWC